VQFTPANAGPGADTANAPNPKLSKVFLILFEAFEAFKTCNVNPPWDNHVVTGQGFGVSIFIFRKK